MGGGREDGLDLAEFVGVACDEEEGARHFCLVARRVSERWGNGFCIGEMKLHYKNCSGDMRMF